MNRSCSWSWRNFILGTTVFMQTNWKDMPRSFTYLWIMRSLKSWVLCSSMSRGSNFLWYIGLCLCGGEATDSTRNSFKRHIIKYGIKWQWYVVYSELKGWLVVKIKMIPRITILNHLNNISDKAAEDNSEDKAIVETVDVNSRQEIDSSQPE